ncbi:MAG: BrnT family toxin [Deltaproteobacteria bacterium]|nr:MAG: BrnT family toxin [Deltaproteobacteria bacterium]
MFTWDANKAILNSEKHGVPFEEAATVFGDPDGLEWEDIGHSQREARRKRLGRSGSGRVLLVVYTIRRSRHGNEAIRIISARQASRKERTAYARQPD